MNNQQSLTVRNISEELCGVLYKSSSWVVDRLKEEEIVIKIKNRGYVFDFNDLSLDREKEVLEEVIVMYNDHIQPFYPTNTASDVKSYIKDIIQ